MGSEGYRERKPHPVIASLTLVFRRPAWMKRAIVLWPLDYFASLAMMGRVQRRPLPVIARSSCDEAIQPLLCGAWIVSWSLSLGAHSRDPLGRPAWMKRAIVLWPLDCF